MNPSESTYDVVVVGAGIVGAACAYFLVKEGLRVAVLERGIAGGGATAAAMGHLVAMDDSPAQLALTKLSLQLWKELEEQLPPSAEYRQPGTLWIASDDEEMAEVRALPLCGPRMRGIGQHGAWRGRAKAKATACRRSTGVGGRSDLPASSGTVSVAWRGRTWSVIHGLQGGLD